MLARGGPDFGRLSPPFAAVSSGYIPDDPFKLIPDSPTTYARMPDELRENDIHYDSLRHRQPYAGMDSYDEEKQHLPGDILSPLNDLQASPDRRDDERFRVIKSLEKLDLADDSSEIGYGGRQQHRGGGGGGRRRSTSEEQVFRTLKHSKSNGSIVDEVTRRKIIDEEGELCEHCLLEERRLAATRNQAILKDKLEKHIHDVNETWMNRSKRRVLLPMGVLPPFMNRDDDLNKNRLYHEKAAYRRELEDEIARKKLESELEKARDKAMHNYANTEDARAYALEREEQKMIEISEKERNRDILEKQMELRKFTQKESEDRLEWWEKKEAASGKPIERDERFLSDQLRRNEALERSVENLQRFKEMDKEERLAKHAADRDFYGKLREKIDEQSALIHSGDGPSKVRRFVTIENPTVYKAWQDAHLLNDKRYRVLQDIDAQRHRRRIVDEEARCIRCRRCKKLIRKEVRRQVID
uniref:Uncharacterized protein n=1 Tax=Panagrolaimus sp. ES5 TaxID=591445 RepID=A0AC34FH47_9BILA